MTGIKGPFEAPKIHCKQKSEILTRVSGVTFRSQFLCFVDRAYFYNLL